MEFVVLVLVLGGCFAAYVLIGEAFDYFFDRPSPEDAHREAVEGPRRRRPWYDDNDPFNG